jgi:ribosomal protein S26
VVVTPRPIYPKEKDGTHSTGGRVSSTGGLERGGKLCPHQGSNFIPSTPWPIAIPITLVIFNPYVNIKYYLESRSRGIFYMKYVNRRVTGLVTFCVETAFYNGLLKERYKGDRSDRKTRKKTLEATG